MIKTLRGRPDHLELSQPLGAAPLDYLMLNFPFRCNYICGKCCNAAYTVHQELPRSSFFGGDELRGVVDQAHDLGARVVVIAGEGEPTLTKGIEEVIAYAYSRGMITIMFTNGSTMNQQRATFCRDNGTSLIISLDSLNEERYDALVGKQGAFRRASPTLALVRDVYRGTETIEKGHRIVRLAVNTLVSRHNEEEIEAIRAFCGEDMLFVCNYPSPHGEIKRRWEEYVGTKEDYERLKDTSRRMSETTGHSTMTPDRKCAYQHYGIAVGSDGSYLTCAYNEDMHGMIREVRTMSLRDAVAHIRALEQRFHDAYGQQPCLLRHEDFDSFLRIAQGAL